MDLTEFGKELVKVGLPLLGAALPLPGGAALGAALAASMGFPVPGGAPDLLQKLQTSADAIATAKQFELTHQEIIVKVIVDADIRSIEAVNKTMQAEAASNHWPTYSWRPFNGFIFGTTFFGVYFLLPVLSRPVPVIPTEAWIAIGAILGVASWFRGKAQADPSIPTDNRG